jgi:carboxyl-terminal processing protease
VILRKTPLALILAAFVLSLGACTSTPTTAPAAPAGPSATKQVVVVTATPEPTSTKKPLNPIQATAQALAQSVTLVPPTRGPEPDDYVGMIEQAWNLINQNYYSDKFNGVDWPAALEEYKAKAEAIQSQEQFWQLMDEFVGSLGDSHSNFRTPAEVSARYGSGSSGAGRPWTGIEMWPPAGHLDGELSIFAVCDVGPAASAGLQRGDHILAINGDPVNLNADTDLEALARRVMFGDEGDSTVVLNVKQGPDAAPRDVTLRLGGASNCDGWYADLVSVEPRIGYLRIPDFDSGSDTVILDTIEGLEEERPLDGLILDIRHNPGGNSDADIAIFTQGTFGTVGPKREGKSRPLFKIRGPVKWNETTPVVLLTDESSHSAADYFAVAMKLSGRATIIGMPTAGNTDGWTSFTMPDGSQIGIAIMILELPDGSSIEGVGVQPDITVRGDDWGMREVPDIQLQTGIDFLLGQ